ncbi:MAG: membrane protein insertase YidC [Porticoccaceae bacterium]|nr:membrane protein insertase YidC [Pseudomonadales bacterium]MCP5172918.1 membrane protein insertase YidC [Pseudomonadales bacterium]MCP5302391.1 membrane protein insertase YidC [Pseudomonadales bacterium]
MDWQRSLLIGAMVAVVYLLFLEWNTFQEQHQPAQQAGVSETLLTPELPSASQLPLSESTGTDVPLGGSDNNGVKTRGDSMFETLFTSRLVSVKTDVLDIQIDTQGGDIVRAGLLKHRTTLDDDSEPFTLLNRTTAQTYVAQSGLIGKDGTDTKSGRPLFLVAKDTYQLKDGQDELVVQLVLERGGVTITKNFIFRRGDYLVDLVYDIDNRGDEGWSAGLFGQIKRDSQDVAAGSAPGMGVQPFLGAALTTSEENYKKMDFEDIAEKPLKETVGGGWVAMVQHYFISAWIPDQSTTNSFNLRKLGGSDLYTLGFTSPAVSVEPGNKGEIRAAFYVGPKDQYRLEKISPYLDLTVDYGWLWWIAKPLFWIMYQLHNIVGNWGWSIILLTVLVKAAFFKLSATSYKSMAKMRKLQPEMARIRELYSDDRQKMSQETMNLYKKEKVNPMGGCLPILVQMPVFLALYWVLLESVELRHAPWIFWIQDMSVKDPLFILPLLMGASMFIQQKLNPAPPDPTQAKVMQIMPIAFTFFFLFFPAGLVLYWTVNNTLSIIQQWIITRKIEAAG